MPEHISFNNMGVDSIHDTRLLLSHFYYKKFSFVGGGGGG